MRSATANAFGRWARWLTMNLDYVPLLRVMRELQGIPRGQPPDFNGMKRFRHFVRRIFPRKNNGEIDENAVYLIPLLAINPMAKDHVTALLDAYLAMDADGIGARVAAEVAAQYADVPGDFKVGLIVVDDLMGAGTNRCEYEFTFRFGPDRTLGGSTKRLRWVKDWWLTGLLWSSEPASERAVREAILTAAHRVAYMQQHGPARTLREMLAQEGQVMALAGCSGPTLDAEDIAYTREALAPFLDADDIRTCMECLFGDAAARTLGFTPRGLSPWAGLALALHDARSNLTLQPSGPAGRRPKTQRLRGRPGRGAGSSARKRLHPRVKRQPRWGPNHERAARSELDH